jgi:hypothetical protein
MDFELTEEQRAFAQTARDFALAELAPTPRTGMPKASSPKRRLPRRASWAFAACMRPKPPVASPCPGSTPRWSLKKWRPWTPAPPPSSPSTTWPPGCWAPGPARRARPLGPAAHHRAKAGQLLPDRARRGLGRRLAQDPRRAGGPRIRHQRQQGLHQRRGRHRCAGADGAHGRRASGAGGISAFVVPADAPGITYGKKEHKMGWNSQPTRTISFDNVRIPANHLLGREGEGFKIAMKGLDGGRINIATCSVGAAQGALNQAQQYMQDRKQFGKPIASFQALQFKLADMATELVAARQMVRLAASKLDAGARDAIDLLRHGQALCHRRGLQRLQRGPATARRLRLHPRIPAGAPAARRPRAPDPGRHQRNHARHHCAAHARRRCAGCHSLAFFDSCCAYP